ncbi:MAG: hypothetical protein QOE93_409 [Actinomycetota bacterium]|nr:hypothetical protein [Actinomycetota bacterium]
MKLTATRNGTTRRRQGLIGAALACMLVLPLAVAGAPAASAQLQGVGMAVSPLFPAFVVVGQTNVAGQLLISNNSGGVGAVTLTEITLSPACGDPGFSCLDADLAVLQLSGAGAGSSGACTGVVFGIQPTDANGRSVFTPATPIILQPPGMVNDDCLINFTFAVLKTPTKDADASAGAQTRHFATTTGFALTGLFQTLFGNGAGTSITTVGLAPPAITTRASGSIALGGSITDTATLSAGVNPTGVITFTLFGPNNATCSGTPRFTSVVPVSANGDYTSAPFTPAGPGDVGTYSWMAIYGGDLNNGPAGPNACNDVLEAVTVTQQPSPVTTIPTVTTLPPGVNTTVGPAVLPSTAVSPRLVRTGTNQAAMAGLALLLMVVGGHVLVESRRRHAE